MLRCSGFAFVLALALPMAAEEPELGRGFPLMDVITEKQHAAGSQIFSIAQRSDGTLFVGGLAGVASYDGAWWRRVALPNESAAFAVAASTRGPEIATGGIGQFGWVGSEAHGMLTYHSLVEQLPAAQRDIGEVRSICASGSGFLYAADHALIEWTGGAPRVIADVRDNGSAPRCFSANGRVYVALVKGLHRLDGSQLTRVNIDGPAELVVPLDDTRLVVAIRDQGLFTFDGTTAVPFARAATEWLRGKRITAGCRLQDGRIMVGTRQDGALILDARGDVTHRLDSDGGLPRAVLNAALADAEGSLWVGYNGPVARIDLATPLTIIDGRTGLQGSASTVERHGGRLYIGGSHGLFVLDAAIRRLDALPPPVWDAVSVDGELLVLTGNGVYSLRSSSGSSGSSGFLGVPRSAESRGTPRNSEEPRSSQFRAQLIPGTEGISAYEGQRSPSDPATFWVATKKGPARLRRDATGWRFDGIVTNVPYVRTVHESDGVLWCGTVFNGLLRIDPRNAPPQVEQFGTGEISVAKVAGAIVATQKGVVYRPAAGGRLVPDPRFANVHGNYFQVLEDTRGNVWMNSSPPQILPRLRDGRYAAAAIPLVSAEGRPQMMTSLGDTVWFSGYTALYRYDLGARTVAYPQPRPLIGRVTTADERPVAAPLPSSFGRLRIEFGPAAYRPGVAYQYRLDPADAQWSAWTTQPAIDYTNLEHGQYTFRVRVRGAAGQLSEETQWMFTVLPPWYRTTGALVLWIVLAALLVAAIVQLRTRTLNRQAERLRALIEEKTEELLEANAHLERLSLLDDLTGIANRRYFQRALVEDWKTAHAEGRPLALIVLDLDHFKQLNDQQGHPAGDAALVQVGRYLARLIRRSGEFGARVNDLVARIGGEEFAVLLMRADEEDARRVAETLRAGIEQLPIGITASCGVAAMIPRDTESWGALMTDADRALYAAKAAGRNCVRTAGEAPEMRVSAPA